MSDTVAYLQSLKAVRERCQQVFNLAEQGKLEYFELNHQKEQKVVDFCKEIIERDFGHRFDTIPPHGRANHFFSPGRDRIALLATLPNFPTSSHEKTKCLLDLYVVSVLLDAGAGNVWTYEEVGPDGNKTGWKGGRSEGLAVASYVMFCKGFFSSDLSQPYQVDAKALLGITPQRMAAELQITDSNPMDGLEGRASLLMKLGEALQSQPDVFPHGRPGDMLDSFAAKFPADSAGKVTVPIEHLWQVLINSFGSIWPARLTLHGQPLGDVWHCSALSAHLDSASTPRKEGDDLVPFHKLSQWLCYSLIQPMEHVAGWKIDGWEDLMTGLPEYRNGGVCFDLGWHQLRPGALSDEDYPNGKSSPPRLRPDHPAIIEWRALTVISLDRIAAGLRKSFSITDPHDLTLAQVLESATWKGGREIAMVKRGASGGGPPIEIISDGTVF